MVVGSDRGYAFISEDEHGVVTIKVATGVERGQPVGVFAVHVGPPRVHVDRGVRFIRTATHQRTAQVVEVTKGGADRVVIRPQVRPPRIAR